jgi:hypothetical protein
MTIYIGNTDSKIDWDSVIKLCQSNSNPDKNTVTSVVDRSEAEAIGDNKLLESYRTVIGKWKQAGYNLEDIVWYDYYPGHHFPLEIQTVFSEIVQAKPLRVFISEVMPGKIVPYHWDVEDKEDEWLSKYGMLYRYVCCIDKPRPASVLVFDKEALYFNKQGDIFQWDHYKDFHSAANGGEFPQYYFHFLGYK